MENKKLVEQLKTVIRMKIPYQAMFVIMVELLEHGPTVLDKLK